MFVGKKSFISVKCGISKSPIPFSTSADHMESGTSRLYRSRGVETVTAQLNGLNLSSSQNNKEQSDSLLQHIQVWD